MILLHLTVVALYGLAAWALWPAPQGSASGDHGPAPHALRPSPALANWLVPLALALHAFQLGSETVTPAGLDLSLDNALSVVAGLVALVAWFSGLLRTMPAIATVVLPVAAIASLLPELTTRSHPFPYADQPWAAVHVAVALIAYALFLVAALQALVLMGLEKRLRHRLPDPTSDSMPPLLTLERFLFRLVGLGFVLLTFTLASGFLFSEQVFGKPFVLTHKSILSVFGWLTFGGLLWGRWRYGWRGRIALRWILAGTIFIFLAYLGYKFVLEVILGR